MSLRGYYETVRTRWAVQASREDVPAVDAGGLERLLHQTRMHRKFDRGEMKCKFCRRPVSEATVYALIRESGAIKAVCSQPGCVAQLVSWIEGR